MAVPYSTVLFTLPPSRIPTPILLPPSLPLATLRLILSASLSPPGTQIPPNDIIGLNDPTKDIFFPLQILATAPAYFSSSPYTLVLTTTTPPSSTDIVSYATLSPDGSTLSMTSRNLRSCMQLFRSLSPHER